MLDDLLGDKPAAAPDEPDPKAGRRWPHRLAQRLLVAGLAIALIGVGWGADALVAHGSRADEAARKPVRLGIATVRRTDLVVTRTYVGTLRHPSLGTVRPGSGGTVTALPRSGQRLEPGRSLLRVDGRPVAVLFGATPIYRALGPPHTDDQRIDVQSAQANLLAARAALLQVQRPVPGGGRASQDVDERAAAELARTASIAQARAALAQAQRRLTGARHELALADSPEHGPDVALLARNMADLGYYHGSTHTWTAALATAVRHWQRRLGVPADAKVEPDQVLVVAGAARVGAVLGRTGDAASSVAITLVSPAEQATFTLHGAAPAALAVGGRVRVSAGTAVVPGRVRAVLSSSPQSTTVDVALADTKRVEHLDATAAHLTISVAARRGVLAVPLQALLALASGGYALQLPAGRLLPIHTGIVQGGRIEVSGPDVHTGLRVVSAT